MNTVSKIYALNTTIVGEMIELNENLDLTDADALVVDPTDACSLTCKALCPVEGEPEVVSGADFAQIVSQSAMLARQVRTFLYERGGVLVVFIRPLQNIYHQRYRDFTVNNYDWLWSGIGREYAFELHRISGDRISLTEMGEKGPFGHYLSRHGVYQVVAQKNQGTALATNEEGDAVALVMDIGAGRVVFLPRFYSSEVSAALTKGIRHCKGDEWWPRRQVHRNHIEWLNQYPTPEIAALEEDLVQKAETISALELEYEAIHKRLIELERLRDFILAGRGWQMAVALARILNDWGFEARPDGNLVAVTCEGRKGLFLAEYCDGIGQAWVGEHLLRLLQPGVKGVIILNPYRTVNPATKQSPPFSSELVNLAQEHDISLLTAVQFFEAYKENRAAIIPELLQQVQAEPGAAGNAQPLAEQHPAGHSASLGAQAATMESASMAQESPGAQEAQAKLSLDEYRHIGRAQAEVQENKTQPGQLATNAHEPIAEPKGKHGECCQQLGESAPGEGSTSDTPERGGQSTQAQGSAETASASLLSSSDATAQAPATLPGAANSTLLQSAAEPATSASCNVTANEVQYPPQEVPGSNSSASQAANQAASAEGNSTQLPVDPGVPCCGDTSEKVLEQKQAPQGPKQNTANGTVTLTANGTASSKDLCQDRAAEQPSPVSKQSEAAGHEDARQCPKTRTVADQNATVCATSTADQEALPSTSNAEVLGKASDTLLSNTGELAASRVTNNAQTHASVGTPEPPASLPALSRKSAATSTPSKKADKKSSKEKKPKVKAVKKKKSSAEKVKVDEVTETGESTVKENSTKSSKKEENKSSKKEEKKSKSKAKSSEKTKNEDDKKTKSSKSRTKEVKKGKNSVKSKSKVSDEEKEES